MKIQTNDKIKIDYLLEAVFLRDVVETLQQMKLEHDRKRDIVSTTINKLFNAEWGKKNADIQRGAIIGVLKHAEMAMNDTYVKIAKLDLLIRSRVSELYRCSNAEESKRRSK